MALYLVSKKLPRRLRYRGYTYALPLRDVRHLPPDEASLPHGVRPEEMVDMENALRHHVIPTNELDRIRWERPVISDVTDVVVQGEPVRGGKTTLKGRAPFGDEIELVLTWAYTIPEEGNPQLVYTNLENESTHALVDASGKPEKLDQLMVSYLQKAVDPLDKGIQITAPPPPRQKRLHAQALLYEGHVYLLVEPTATDLEYLL